MSLLDCDVLLLSAGYGKRLRPLTENCPKPLVKLAGKTLIERNLEWLSRAGFKRVFINLHYRGDMIRSALGSGSSWGLEIVYVEEQELLDTGGAIKNIQAQLEHDALLTVNSDILLGPEFEVLDLLRAHQNCRLAGSCSPLSTMALRPDKYAESFGSLGVDEGGRLIEFLGEQYIPGHVAKRLMFLGIQVLSSRIYSLMHTRKSVFSITKDTLVAALKNKEYINTWIYQGYWSDVGTIERFNSASKKADEIFGVS